MVAYLLPVMVWAWTHETSLAWKTEGKLLASGKGLFTSKISIPPLLGVDVAGGDAWNGSSHLVPSLRMQPTCDCVQQRPREEELVL